MMANSRIGVGIVGLGYGCTVHLPAVRRDGRAEVRALCARNAELLARASSDFGVPQTFTDWHQLVAAPDIHAIVISVPPAAQVEIATAALAAGKAVLAEKPLALDLAGASILLEAAKKSSQPNMVDFNFTRINAFIEARKRLNDGTIGSLRHVVISWSVENYVNKMRLQHWKANEAAGGGALFSFVSHSLHYIEWLAKALAGPIIGLAGRLERMPGDSRSADSSVTMAFAFRSGASGALFMSAAAFPGTGHRIEFYGETGALLLENSGPDYMSGFHLSLATRDAPNWTQIPINDPQSTAAEDGRILPASRLMADFLTWIISGHPAEPNFADGWRVQLLLDRTRRASDTGCWQSLPDADEAI
jgi:predicted dehydrogenase